MKLTLNAQWGAAAVEKCRTKVRYSSEAEAQLTIDTRRSNKRFTPPKLFVYRSRVCSWYHITSQRPIAVPTREAA